MPTFGSSPFLHAAARNGLRGLLQYLSPSRSNIFLASSSNDFSALFARDYYCVPSQPRLKGWLPSHCSNLRLRPSFRAADARRHSSCTTRRRAVHSYRVGGASRFGPPGGRSVLAASRCVLAQAHYPTVWGWVHYRLDLRLNLRRVWAPARCKRRVIQHCQRNDCDRNREFHEWTPLCVRAVRCRFGLTNSLTSHQDPSAWQKFQCLKSLNFTLQSCEQKIEN